MASRQRYGYISRKKDDHRATCNACKTSLSSKGGKTTITPKHLSILHAITLQECHVFERYGVTITLMNLNQATAVRLTLALHLLILKVQIRPGRVPYLIRLFSRLPHLMRFLSLDVLLQKWYETYYQISHTFCYLWLEL